MKHEIHFLFREFKKKQFYYYFSNIGYKYNDFKVLNKEVT